MSLSTNRDADSGNEAAVSLSHNNMDAPEHQAIYEKGMAMRMQVVGEDYVANALAQGSTDFLRPLQQLATVIISSSFVSLMLALFYSLDML
jgi:hypothetical protein